MEFIVVAYKLWSCQSNSGWLIVVQFRKLHVPSDPQPTWNPEAVSSNTRKEMPQQQNR